MTDPLQSDTGAGGPVGFLRRGLASATARNTAWLGSSSVVNGALGAASSALLARGLGIESFGTFTLVLTLINLLADLSDLGLGGSLVRFGSDCLARDDRARLRQVLAAVLRMKLLLALIVIGGAFLFLRPLMGLLFAHVDGRIGSYVVLAIGAAVITIAGNLFPPLYQTFGRFRLQALTSVARALARLLFIIAVLHSLIPLTVTTALWIEAASILAFLLLSYAGSPVKRFPLGGSDPGVAREVLAFNRWVVLYQLITLVVNKLDVFIVGGLAGASVLGLYGAAAKVAGVMVAVCNAYLAVLIVEMSGAISSPAVLARRLRIAHGVTGLMAGGSILLGLAAAPLMELLYGPLYAGAVPVFRIMCIGVAFTVLAYPPGALLFARARTAAFPVMAVLSAAGLVGANVLLLPRLGATGGAIAFALSAFIAWLTAVAFAFVVPRLKSSVPA